MTERDEHETESSDRRGETTMERTFDTPNTVRLYVENGVGFVGITAHETDTTTVDLEAETPGAEEVIERATVECRPAGNQHIVTVKIPKTNGMRFMRRNAVTVRVSLPAGSDVSAITASADVEIQGPIGTADVKTASGDVSTDDVADQVVAQTSSGDIEVGAVGGDLRVATASGDLRCSHVRGRATFKTTSGDIEVGAADNRVEVKATSGQVRLGDLANGARVTNVSGDVRVLALVEGTLHVRSVSGSVAVGVVPGVDLRVDVETMSGHVSSEFPLDDAPSGGGHNSARAEISVRSVSGDVEIERALEAVA
jgi:DUF4097 and DUF4098 domain-containing protein YvlB